MRRPCLFSELRLLCDGCSHRLSEPRRKGFAMVENLVLLPSWPYSRCSSRPRPLFRSSSAFLPPDSSPQLPLRRACGKLRPLGCGVVRERVLDCLEARIPGRFRGAGRPRARRSRLCAGHLPCGGRARCRGRREHRVPGPLRQAHAAHVRQARFRRVLGEVLRHRPQGRERALAVPHRVT